MEDFDTLTELWASWCAQNGVECRDATEMAIDDTLPRHVQHMARRFLSLWEGVEG